MIHVHRPVRTYETTDGYTRRRDECDRCYRELGMTIKDGKAPGLCGNPLIGAFIGLLLGFASIPLARRRGDRWQ